MKTENFLRKAAAIVAIAAATMAAGTPVVADKADNSLVFGQGIPITDLGPAIGAFLRYPAGYEASFALYDRLVTFDADLNIKPQLAESWEASDGGKTMTFKLREGVKFHDGTSFNAEAVKFHVDRMINPERNPTGRPLWDPITGATVIDEHTVAVHTEKPFALLLNTFAHGTGAMISPTALQENGEDSMTLNPVGAGPFKLESFTPGTELVVTAFDDYWAGRPKLDSIVFKYIPEAQTRIAALRTGSVDVIDSVPTHLISGLQSSPDIQIVSKPGLRPMGFAIRTTREPYNDVKVRQALNYLVPVKLIAERIFLGFAKASDSPIAFNTGGYKSVGGFDHDPAKAEALLAEAGFKDSDGDGILDRDGKPFTMKLLTSEGQFPGDIQVTEVANKAFRDAGIDARITKVEQGSYFEALRLKESDLQWDLALFGFNPSNGAGTFHLDAMFHSNPDDADRPKAWNIVRFRNGEVDDLIDEAKVTVDPAARNELLGKAQDIIQVEAPYVWMHVPEIVSAVRKDVTGVEVWPIIFTIVRGAHY